MGGLTKYGEYAHESELIGKVIEKLGSDFGFKVILIGSGGDVLGSDPTAKYKISDVDADAAVKYYGYLDADGNWYIMKEETTTGDQTYTYCKGATAYATAWTGRAGLTYDIFSEIF
ncbi:MAG: hypothetical protein ABFC84_16640 [Veillonellales bacterium]